MKLGEGRAVWLADAEIAIVETGTLEKRSRRNFHEIHNSSRYEGKI